jgi:hypothetical protein
LKESKSVTFEERKCTVSMAVIQEDVFAVGLQVTIFGTVMEVPSIVHISG